MQMEGKPDKGVAMGCSDVRDNTETSSRQYYLFHRLESSQIFSPYCEVSLQHFPLDVYSKKRLTGQMHSSHFHEPNDSFLSVSTTALEQHDKPGLLNNSNKKCQGGVVTATD